MRRALLAALAAYALVFPALGQPYPPFGLQPQPVSTVTVTSSATLLYKTVSVGETVCATNTDASLTVFVSWSSGVTASGSTKGRPLGPSATICYDSIDSANSLFGITSSSTVAVAVESMRRR